MNVSTHFSVCQSVSVKNIPLFRIVNLQVCRTFSNEVSSYLCLFVSMMYFPFVSGIFVLEIYMALFSSKLPKRLLMKTYQKSFKERFSTFLFFGMLQKALLLQQDLPSFCFPFQRDIYRFYTQNHKDGLDIQLCLTYVY